MPNYQRLYTLLFNAITDALACFEAGRPAEAVTTLKRAQQRSEEAYISDDPPVTPLSCQPNRTGQR